MVAVVVFLSARVSDVEEEVADGGAAGGSVEDAVLVAVVLVVRAERRWRCWLILCVFVDVWVCDRGSAF